MALLYATARNKAANLERALQSNREIGMAIGVLMIAHHVTERQAFDALRKESQYAHRKLRAVAADVVLTGEMPVRAIRPDRQQTAAARQLVVA